MKTVDPLIVRQLLCAVATALVASAPSADARWPQVGVRAERVIDESRATYFVSPDGDDARDGRSRAAAFHSMQKAADVVEPGETVLVLRGVYADGSQVEVQLLVGRHVLEWSFDPAWQTSAALNDNNAYLAWEGPGGHDEPVRLYYLRWVNEQPANRIRSIRLSTAQSTADEAFLLLGMTGARIRPELAAGQRARVFHLSWDGEVDAQARYARLRRGAQRRRDQSVGSVERSARARGPRSVAAGR